MISLIHTLATWLDIYNVQAPDLPKCGMIHPVPCHKEIVDQYLQGVSAKEKLTLLLPLAYF